MGQFTLLVFRIAIGRFTSNRILTSMNSRDVDIALKGHTNEKPDNASALPGFYYSYRLKINLLSSKT